MPEAANHESGSLSRLFLEGMEGIHLFVKGTQLFVKNIIHSELNWEAFGCKKQNSLNNKGFVISYSKKAGSKVFSGSDTS